MKKQSKTIGTYALITLLFLGILFIGIEQDQSGDWSVGASAYALTGGETGGGESGGGESGSGEFIYRIVKDKPCNFTATVDAHVSAINRLLGINAKIGVEVDLGDATALYALGGPFRLGNDVSCATLVQSML